MSTSNGEDMTLYVANPVLHTTLSKYGIPAGCTDLLAWNVSHGELVDFVSNLSPGSRYRAVFVEMEESK